MCFVAIVLGKVVYFFSLSPLSKSRLAVIFTKCICQRLLEANSLRSKVQRQRLTCYHWLDLAEGTSLPLRRRG